VCIGVGGTCSASGAGGARVAVKVGCRELQGGCWSLLTWRTLTQSRGARQKPPDHEVGNTVRNDRGFVDVGIGTHKRHKRCRGDSERTQQGTGGQKTRSGLRARRAGRRCRESSRHSSVYRVGTRERVATGASGDGRVPEGAYRGTALLMTGTSGGDTKLSKLARDTNSAGVWAWMRYRACLWSHEQVWRT